MEKCSTQQTILGFLLATTLSIAVFNTAKAAEIPRVVFETQGDKVVVTYDLIGVSKDDEFRVTLVLRKENDNVFRYYPKNTQGDVGVGRYAGYGKKIIWNLLGEFPDGLVGDNYYFEVLAEEISPSNTWTWIGAGAAVIVGGFAALYLFRDGPDAEPRTSSFPSPPGRP